MITMGLGFYPATVSMEKLGRRVSIFYVYSSLLIVAMLLQFLAKPLGSVWLLILGRASAGLALCVCNVAVVYLMECYSALRRRGFPLSIVLNVIHNKLYQTSSL